MTRLAVPLLFMALGCSDLTEGAGGIVELEVRVPAVTTIEVGDAVQLSAIALDSDGNEVNVPISWRTSDPSLSVDDTGLVTGVVAGAGQVQAFAGALASGQIQLTVIARTDTLVLIGDSVVTVPPEAAGSTPLVVQVRSFSPAEPLSARPVVYTVTSPPDIGAHSVELPGGVLVDTVLTGSDGLAGGVNLNRVAGVPQPDTAIVEVRSYRLSGAEVAGSGQRFLVVFQ